MASPEKGSTSALILDCQILQVSQRHAQRFLTDRALKWQNYSRPVQGVYPRTLRAK